MERALPEVLALLTDTGVEGAKALAVAAKATKRAATFILLVVWFDDEKE